MASHDGLVPNFWQQSGKVFFDAQEVIAQSRSQVVLYKPPPNFLSAEVYALRDCTCTKNPMRYHDMHVAHGHVLS
jgi:hypothetical protein